MYVPKDVASFNAIITIKCTIIIIIIITIIIIIREDDQRQPTCVCANVPAEVAGVAHFLSTDGALVGLLPGVFGLVPLQLRAVEKRCITVRAGPPVTPHRYIYTVILHRC